MLIKVYFIPVDRIFREANVSPNGYVNYDDFVRVVCAPVPDYYWFYSFIFIALCFLNFCSVAFRVTFLFIYIFWFRDIYLYWIYLYFVTFHFYLFLQSHIYLNKNTYIVKCLVCLFFVTEYNFFFFFGKSFNIISKCFIYYLIGV